MEIKTNHHQFKYLPYITMFYTMMLVSTGVYVNKTITLGPLITSAASISFPITLIIANLVTEVYGYSIARRMIWMGLFCQLIFALISVLVVKLPYPILWHDNSHYEYVLGNLIYVFLAALIAAPVGDFINIFTISKTKILFRGKLFWFRSIISIAFGKFAYTSICAIAIFHNRLDNHGMILMILGTYMLTLLYVGLLSYPGSLIALALKYFECCDAYDFHTNFNPFKLTSDEEK